VREGCFASITPPNERTYVTAGDELLMCQCRAASDLTLTFPHWQAPARPPGMHSVRVISRLPLAQDVTQLIVELQDAESFEYLPGQHVQLLFDGGSHRCFSIANTPGAPDRCGWSFISVASPEAPLRTASCHGLRRAMR